MKAIALSVLVASLMLVAGCSDDSSSDETTMPWSGVPATADTVMVYGSWTDTIGTQTGSAPAGGVTVETFEYSEGLELSDSRASGTTEYTSTLYIPDTGVGGTWVVEEVTLVNDAGTWTGYGTGTYIYTNNMPDALTSSSVVRIGEWHLIGDAAYEGLRLDFYSSSDGVIGTINPVA